MEKLLGDYTADALKAIGADKIAEFYERKTGRGCNCAGRKQTLNNLHRAAQRMVERQNAPKPQQVRPPLPKKKDEYVAPTKPVDE